MTENKVKYQLEVCAFSLQSCIIAEKAGAARVELCDNPLEGGTTPSYAAIKRTREKISISLYPIIRPRSLNYFYDQDEWQIMMEDIRICKQLGCDGISIGVQKKDGSIDTDKMKRIAELAYPMGITCNRVFDNVPDPFDALEQLIDCGCERVLTSGQEATAPEGTSTLKKLVLQADNRISIMPGAGVKSSNIIKLMDETGAYEFHTSARRTAANAVDFVNEKITDNGSIYIADENELKKIMLVLKAQG